MPLQTRYFALIFALTAGAAAAQNSEPASGAQIYAQFECAGCHEYAAVQGFEVVVLHDISARYDVATLAFLLAEPPASAPVFPMDDAQRHPLARYLRERFP